MQYKDTWAKHIPKAKLAAYRQMIESGKIANPKVTYNRTTKVTTVEYFSTAPRGQILEEMKQIAEREVIT